MWNDATPSPLFPPSRFCLDNLGIIIPILILILLARLPRPTPPLRLALRPDTCAIPQACSSLPPPFSSSVPAPPAATAAAWTIGGAGAATRRGGDLCMASRGLNLRRRFFRPGFLV